MGAIYLSSWNRHYLPFFYNLTGEFFDFFGFGIILLKTLINAYFLELKGQNNAESTLSTWLRTLESG